MPSDLKKYAEEYRKKNRVRINEYFREYYKRNRALHISRVKKWREKNPEKIEEYRRRAKEDPEARKRQRAALRRWRERNEEKYLKYQIAYNKTRKKKLK